MLEIEPDPRPGAVSSAHCIDQDIGGLQVCGSLRMPGFPAVEPCKRILLVTRSSDLDQRSG
jgi:hypothetical protein